MATQYQPTTRRAAAATADPAPCAECRGTGFDPDCGGHSTDAGVITCECEECAPDDDDADGADDCRWADDVAESAPDDGSRFALVARHYPAAA